MSFIEILKEKNINPNVYLQLAKKNAKHYYDTYDTLTFSDKENKKLMIKDLNDKFIHFGDSRYNDYLIYKLQKNLKADKYRDRYYSSHINIKGDWIDDIYSPNMLSLLVNW